MDDLWTTRLTSPAKAPAPPLVGGRGSQKMPIRGLHAMAASAKKVSTPQAPAEEVAHKPADAAGGRGGESPPPAAAGEIFEVGTFQVQGFDVLSSVVGSNNSCVIW